MSTPVLVAVGLAVVAFVVLRGGGGGAAPPVTEPAPPHEPVRQVVASSPFWVAYT